MSDRVHELLRRNLQEVFGENNAARRRVAIRELYTEDCVLYVPPGVFFYMDPAHYRANFAVDSPPELADFMAASQVLLSKKAFEAAVRAAAWKMKPSWAVVPSADRTINPALEGDARRRHALQLLALHQRLGGERARTNYYNI